MPAHFSPELFTFLRALKKNNERAWFEANKPRYLEHARDPMLRFIADFAPHLEKITPHLLADERPNGRSMFRIHRDVRFGKDKSPYKAWVSARFQHEQAKDVHAPGFYLHLEPGGCFFGAGLWHPDPKTASQIRAFIAEHADRWAKIHRAAPIKSGRLGPSGESLKRPPRGFEADHPLIEDLKRKDFILSAPIPDTEVLSPGFLAAYTKRCREASPYVGFIAEAVGVPY